MKNVSILVIALLTAVVPSVLGQETTGAIASPVVGPDRSALPGVTVTVTGAQGIKTAVSDGNGHYSVPFPTPGVLHVALAFDAGATPAFEAAAAEEAARVWAPYGIALEESPADSPCHSGIITLHVAMAQTPDRGTNPHALGSIVFTGGAPEPRISLYVATAADLVSAATHNNPSHWPVAYHDAILSRVLGRALAHEIGHYLLNAQTHSKSGLMRAVQPVTELMEFRDTNLALSPADVATLCRKTAVVMQMERTWPEPAVGASRLPAGSRSGSKLERQGR